MMNKYSITAAYPMTPNEYYLQNGSHQQYVKFFENELDCLRWCNAQEEKYGAESIWVEPDSEKYLAEHILRSKAR